MPGTLAALRHRNFRLLWLGLVVSNVGTQMQFVAQDYYVYTITGRAFWLGVVDAAGAVTLIAVSLVGGALADRLPKRRLLLATQSLLALMPAVMGALIWTRRASVWHVVAFSVLSMAVLAVDNPTRQALLPRLVPRERFLNAVSLNAITWSGAAALGPALAGPVIAAWGVPAAFALDAASSFAVLGAILALRLPAQEREPGPLGRSLREGASYLRRTPVLLLLASILAVVAFFAFPYQTLMPAFNARALGGGVVALGLLRAAPGVGALAGGLFAASLRKEARTPRRILEGALGFGAALAAFAFARWLPLNLALLVLAGALFTLFQSTTQTFLQLQSDDAMRGRVMSLFALAVIGIGPLGSFPMGWLADRIGVGRAIALGALLAALYVLGAWTLGRRLLRGLSGDARAARDARRRSSPSSRRTGG